MLTYESLICDKRVAIVGPAMYMMDSRHGKEIDSFDTIVRLNRSCESIEKYKDDIGSRTDVLYSCLIEKNANGGLIDINRYKNEYKIKYVCAPPTSNMKGLSNQTRFHDLVNKEKVKELNKSIPVRLIEHEFQNKIALSVDCRPNTGYLAIYDLIRLNPKELKIFGFSFYLDGFIKGVKDGIQQEQNKSEEEFAVQCFTSKRHNQFNMWNFAKQTLVNHPTVRLDPTLTKILEMKELSKKTFKEIVSKK